MLVQAFLRGLVIVRNHQQAGVGTELFRFTGQLDGFPGAVAAGASDDRNTAINTLYDMTDGLDMLFRVQCCGLTRSANSNNAIGAVFNMKIDQFVQLFPVNVTIGMHGRDQCDKATRNHKSSVRIKPIW